MPHNYNKKTNVFRFILFHLSNSVVQNFQHQLLPRGIRTEGSKNNSRIAWKIASDAALLYGKDDQSGVN